MTSPSVPDHDGSEILVTFIENQLTYERDRRTIINARGIALITNSSALATLVLSAAALLTAGKDYYPPRLSVWALAATFLSFSGAALFGLIANRTFQADVVSPQQLEDWRQPMYWGSTKAYARKLIAKANIHSLTTIRAGNNQKVRACVWGYRFQIIALVTLAVAVGAIFVVALLPGHVGFFHELANR